MEFKNFKTGKNSVHTKIIFSSEAEYKKLLKNIDSFLKSDTARKLQLESDLTRLRNNLVEYFILNDSYNDNKITSVVWNDSMPVLVKIMTEFIKKEVA